VRRGHAEAEASGGRSQKRLATPEASALARARAAAAGRARRSQPVVSGRSPAGRPSLTRISPWPWRVSR
jgi:hypothetical protein